MQKVVGSSPIIRSTQYPPLRRVSVSRPDDDVADGIGLIQGGSSPYHIVEEKKT